MDLISIGHAVVKAIQPTAEYISTSFGKIDVSHAEEKSRHSLVSEVDINAEKQLVMALKKILPEAGFVTEEETTNKKNSELYWVIDPLDGTTNFLFGIPNVSISVALKQKGVTVIGIVHHVNSNDTYLAVKGEGATKNNKPIRVSNRKSIEEAMVATGFPYDPRAFLPTQLKMLEHFILKSRGVRRLGSAAIDLAYVAEGIFDIYFESGLNEWDTSAGMLLVREAGGICSDLNGDKSYEAGSEIIACTAHTYDYVLKLVATYRKKP